MAFDIQPHLNYARWLDSEDPLRRFRDAFHLPCDEHGAPLVYFCGHSLGLQPKGVRSVVEHELDNWANLGVDGHFKGKSPWYRYHEQFRAAGGRLVGAQPEEVVMMNSLTVNLHMMLATFYRPTAERWRILIDEPAFPSDLYAVQSQLQLHGYAPGDLLAVPAGELLAALDKHGAEIAVALFSGINFVTGQWLDMPGLTAAAHARGCVVGFDLAHAAGSVPLQLHDWNVDFAVWCNYKYLNCGPGAVGGCFVHEKHGEDSELTRLAGWWGNDPATRFQMDTERVFVPHDGAAGWQVSNPPILAMAPLKASLALFDEAGMPALRTKSEKLTGYLEYLLERLPAGAFEIITPRQADQRGCALSLAVRERAREVFKRLEQKGICCDFRPPNVIRAAPVPLYNTFEEVWTFAHALAQCLTGGKGMPAEPEA